MTAETYTGSPVDIVAEVLSDTSGKRIPEKAKAIVDALGDQLMPDGPLHIHLDNRAVTHTRELGPLTLEMNNDTVVGVLVPEHIEVWTA